MLGRQLIELVDGLLGLLEAQIGGVWGDRVASQILHTHLPTIRSVLQIAGTATDRARCDYLGGVDVEDTIPRPDVPY